MQLSDLTVEVRNKDLDRLGVIPTKDLDLDFTDGFNGVGVWKAELPFEHPMTQHLRTPGSGIIVTDDSAPAPFDVLFSGPTTDPEKTITPADPGGTITFDGVTDTIRLDDTVVIPTPSNGDTYVDETGHDKRSGAAESLMHEYVRAHLGDMYPNSGRNMGELRFGPDGGRGRTLTKSPRYQGMLDLLNEIATPDSLGFRLVQRGDVIRFETYQAQDRTGEIRLDVRNGTLSGERVKTSAPSVTVAIVAGQGEMEDRQVSHHTTPRAQIASLEWGRRIEKFIDQRQTDDEGEQADAGVEALAEGGFTAVAIQAVPNEQSSMRYGRDWSIGDKVAVVVDGTELYVYAVGSVIQVNKDGLKVGIKLGTEYSLAQSAAARSAKLTERRLSNLERNVAAVDDPTRVRPGSVAAPAFDLNTHFIY